MKADHYKVRGGYRLLPNHPFIESFWAEVYPTTIGYKVVWRDYTSMKQDIEFNTEYEAVSFCTSLKKRHSDGTIVNEAEYNMMHGFWGDKVGTSDSFFETHEWRTLRYKVLSKHGAKCQCCGAARADGKRMHVDHIKPRSRFPNLALKESNLQVLCEDCNRGKGAWDDTDWRG